MKDNDASMRQRSDNAGAKVSLADMQGLNVHKQQVRSFAH